MNCFRGLKSTPKVGFLLSVTVVVFIFLTYIMDRYNTDSTLEEKRRECGISICTPCQFLETNERVDSVNGYVDDTLQITLQSKFRPPKRKELEHFSASGDDKIDRIIHQSWKTKMVPMQFKDYIKSFVDNHPSWKYMFWTDHSTRLFINNLYPNLLDLYDNYAHPLNRPDAMRYIVLFHFGGVYSDLDVKSLRPLDPVIKKYSCVLGQEPHVHSIVYTNFYEQASNAFMACRKRHPFMKSVIDNLYQFSFFAHVLDSTGPRFLTFSLRQYMIKNKDLQVSDKDYVFLSPPEYFLPSVDSEITKKLALLCEGFPCLSPLRQWQCEQWKQEGVRTEPHPISFTNHVWSHTTYKDHFPFYKENIYIFVICQDVLIYNNA
ncbi:hypothetical protein ACJMK2_012485 [Sinanodonta woodiana]|uniref:Uncharacterized protein n=1 Tax=Sinanodonta woodiana TaxID=1069815 RepID=A0ABD3V8D9_SINWO